MSNVAIRVRGLGKCYRIGRARPFHAMHERLESMVRAPFRGNGRAGASDVEHIWALADVSFDVHRGEILGVIGPNGAGKSALLKILARVTRPTCGQAELHGRVSAMLEADVGFHPELTGRENIALSGAILGMTRGEIARKFEAIVAMAGVEQFLETPVKRYSSGMRVRLALAVATQLESDIMLLDEVLAVGDEQFHLQCLAKLREMARAGRSVVIVSHDMRTVERLCERALHVSDGRIVADGASAQVVAGYLARA